MTTVSLMVRMYQAILKRATLVAIQLRDPIEGNEGNAGGHVIAPRTFCTLRLGCVVVLFDFGIFTFGPVSISAAVFR